MRGPKTIDLRAGTATARTTTSDAVRLARRTAGVALFVLALSLLAGRLGWTGFPIIASGAMVAALALAFQTALSNLIAGVQIAFDSRINIGTWLTCQGYTGEIVDLGPQTAELRTIKQERVLLANTALKPGTIVLLPEPPAAV